MTIFPDSKKRSISFFPAAPLNRFHYGILFLLKKWAAYASFKEAMIIFHKIRQKKKRLGASLCFSFFI